MLHKLQRHFLAGIDDSDETPLILADIQATDQLTAAQQLAIYRESHYGGLAKAIAEIYPVCKLLVGDEFFDNMVWRYVKQSPSLHYDLNHYGADFPFFIEHFTPAADLPYLADICRLELVWHQAFYAADHRPFTENDLTNLAPENYETLVFRLAPSTFLLDSEYPILRIWQMAQEHKDETVDLDEGGIKLLIWRLEETRHMLPLKQCEFQFVQALTHCHTFANVCADLLQANPEIDLTRVLHKMLTCGCITSIDAPGPNTQPK